MKKWLWLVCLMCIPVAYGQRCVLEQEPNNSSAEAVLVVGPACMVGETNGDQDVYRLSLSEDVTLRRQLELSLSGTADVTTRLELFKLTPALDGSGETVSPSLLVLESVGAEIVSDPLLFTHGEYLLGVVQSEPGHYQVDLKIIEQGLPSLKDREPNESSAEALEQQGAFSLQGSLQESIDYHRWTLSAEDAKQQWRVMAKAQLDQALTVKLFSSAGEAIISASAEDGPLDFANLVLAADTYTFVLSPASEDPARYFLSASAQGTVTTGVESEPNENDRQINSFDPFVGISGRLDESDTDSFSFILPEAGFYDLDPGLTTRARFLLFDEADREIIDRSTLSPQLSQVFLPAGAYKLRLLRADEASDYTLKLIPSQAPELGFEQEPNDLLDYAMDLSEQQVRGSFSGRDLDIFRFYVDHPQYYRLQVVADKLYTIGIFDEAGNRIYQQNADARRTRLDNVILLAGFYSVVLDGEDSDYVFRALALGDASIESTDAIAGTVSTAEELDPEDVASVLTPPDGILEREPNDEAGRAQPLQAGQTHVGLLSSSRDIDVYQFSLRQDQYVRIEVIPPEGSEFSLDLTGQKRTFIRPDLGFVRGEWWLLAGDYYLSVRTNQPSDSYYQLRLEQLDSVNLPADLEPNNEARAGQLISLPSIITGYLGEARDDDWFNLPAVDSEQQLTVTLLHDMEDSQLQSVFFFDLVSDSWLADPERSEDRTTYTLMIPAGAQPAMRLRGQGAYQLSLKLADQPALDADVDDPLSLDLEFSDAEVAAYWHQGQQLAAQLTLRNEGSEPKDVQLVWHSTDPGVKLSQLPEAVTLAANSQQDLDVSLDLAADLRDNMPITVSVGGRVGEGVTSTQTQIFPQCEARPLNSFPYWPIPDPILGHWNVLSSNLGTNLIMRGEAYNRDLELLDGRASPATGPNHTQGEAIYFDLPGDEPMTLTGALLHPLSRQAVRDQLAEFEVLTSLDDETYQTIYRGRLAALHQEQAFVFPEAVTARYVGLRFLNTQSNNPDSYASLGEFKLLSPDSPLNAVNVADSRLGGHVVWSQPTMGLSHPILSETPEGERGERLTLRLSNDETSLRWVLGFQHNRAAQISRLEWLDHINSSEARRLKAVEVAVSMESPQGPWLPLTTWVLERQAGEDIPVVSPLVLDEPVWARFVRFEVSDLEPRSRHDMPETLRLFEYQADHGLSSLGEWGHYRQEALYEWQHPLQVDTFNQVNDDNDSRERASALPLSQAVSETVRLGSDLDWYKINIPEGDNNLTVNLGGVPSREYSFYLEDANSNPVSYEILQESTSALLISAEVSPGDYYLRIEEPPRSVVFLWDNSGSMGPYTAIIYSALARFSAEIQEGREEVSLAVFDDGGPYFILPQMSGQAGNVLQALNAYDRRHSSSTAETALLGSSEMLAGRVGTRAILMTTDAESNGHDFAAELWQSLGEVKPRVFTFEISSGGNAVPQDLMQSWADAGNGRYQAISSTSDLEVGFARASCLLRRPKAYTVLANSSSIARGPGSLQLTLAESESEEAAAPQTAVEVILDASGSMYKTLEGRFRYEIAKEVLDNLVANTLPDNIPFALRVFGNREESSCRTDLEVALAPLDREGVRSVIAGVEPQPFAFTPLAASIAQVANDLAGTEGRKTVILITDGEESCDGDVTASIQALNDQGIDVQLNIIGFDFDAEDEEAARAQFQAWAELGQGQYYDATSSEELELSLEQAVALPSTFDILDSAGKLVLSAALDGTAVSLEVGFYDVLIDGVIVFEGVEIISEKTTELLWQP